MNTLRNKLFFAFVVLAFLFFAPNVFAESTNIGFVKDSIWYSKDPFQEGDKIKIYTVVWNPEVNEFSGTVNFFDDTALLGKKDFKIAPQSGQIVFIEWTATAGSHKIFAKIEGAKIAKSKGVYEEVYVKENETDKSTRIASKNIPIPELPDIKETLKQTFDQGTYVEAIKDTSENFLKKIPDFISNPVGGALEGIDEFRQDMAEVSKKQEAKVTEQIGMIKVAKLPSQTEGEEQKSPKILKPLKYLELFLLTLALVVFESKVFFYIVGLVIILLIIRFIWSRIF